MITLNELLKTKAGQSPHNRKIIEEAIRRHGKAAPVDGVGVMGNSQLQSDPVRSTLVVKPSTVPASQSRLVLCVTIVRFGYALFDEDNLIAGAKPLRDAIAKSLGVDDADPRILWKYAQVTDGGKFGTLVKIDAL